MDTLSIEPTYRVLLGEVDQFRILQVGCGGTGSALALALGGLAYHARQKGVQVDLTLVDHDVIEERNVGRQSFTAGSASSRGIPKCADLALRLNCAYGLDVTAWPERYEPALGQRWLAGQAGCRGLAHLIIGCVDTDQGRRAIAATVAAAAGRLWGLDCGNERVNGQVLMGNLAAGASIRLDPLGLCSGLPSPYWQEPELLQPDPDAAALSCADRALADPQSVMVNRIAATIAAQYVTTFVLEQQVLMLGTVFTLEPPTAVSRQITATTLAPYC